MKILITGGAGYIGSHICKELSRTKHEFLVYDNLSTGYEELVKWCDLVKGDILDKETLSRTMRQFQPDGIIHFAALSQVGESTVNPDKYINNNVTGTYNILECMKEQNIKSIVVSSTAAVYGIPDEIPINEKTLTNPINPYGQTKLYMEWMLKNYQQAYNISWIALRYFNAAGADPEADTGELHNPETHLIPRVLQSASGELKDFRILGDDYDTPDGTCIRDYIHVTDLASAHILAIEYLSKSIVTTGFSCNLGTGKGYSIKEVIDSVEKITNNKVPYSIGERRKGDPPILVADGNMAKSILNWNPIHSDIDTIIESAWNFYCSNNRQQLIVP